ncbi:NUDIX domain-containing protein [Kineococcus sp. LSe6-4]|uniref:NUDIX domain-containing protein n=1 Tax=Kineococcus halophytocola TaxID=3234027 RepID=A0ABV4H680_9ACTN
MRLRRSARALVLTPDRDVLLAEHHPGGVRVRALPGGGLEPAEDVRSALRRELLEETGLDVDPAACPHVWRRTVLEPWAAPGWDGALEDVFLVRVPAAFTPRGAFDADRLRAEDLHGFGWWSLSEVAAMPAHGVLTAPADLAALVPRALRLPPGAVPLVVGT